MSWLGPPLDQDQRDVVEVVARVLADLSPGDTDALALARKSLADLGLWTVGVPEELGGGGAGWSTTALVIERLSRTAPELGIACAHAHAAALALGGSAHGELLAGLHTADTELVIVESAAPHVVLRRQATRVDGRIDRLDAFTLDEAGVVVLGDSAVLLAPSALRVESRQRTTGLDSFQTAAVAVDGRPGDDVVTLSAPASLVRAQMLGGTAAVAAGIAGAAFDAAAAYARSRHQFGGPISALPAVRRLLEDQALRTANLLRALLAAAPDPIGATAIAREGCDAVLSVADAALQVHGGYGYLKEYPAERFVRDAVSLGASVGTSSLASILQI
jgi:alkylation response protein AidB-like acyl-CoA dehydrogenase